MATANFRRITLIAALLVVSHAASAQDAAADRAQAADRYLRAVPIATMLDDTFAELSKQLPPGQRSEFIQQMKAAVRADAVEQIARASMVKTFSADELNALADFYSSRHGASAMKKFGPYMAEVMPAVQAEVQRGIQQIGAQSRR